MNGCGRSGREAGTNPLHTTLEAAPRRKGRRTSALRGTLCTLITVAALAVLVATLWLPMLRIYGRSMAPTLRPGDILLAVRTSDPGPGDIVAFSCNNKILVKRVIGGPGDWIDMDADGTVYVNAVRLAEPYLTEMALGDCNIELPYQVPDGRFFVMGDHRSTSIDSRNTAVGCVSREQIMGKIILRVWPLERMGILN